MNTHAAAQPRRNATSSSLPTPSPLLQRKCACGSSAVTSRECGACARKRGSMQRKPLSEDAVGEAHRGVHKVLRAPGQPLDVTTRASMEARLGHDFSHVRVHTDPQAAQSARAMNALAYAVSQDIVFGSGRYQPGTNRGQQLLAHELTHVMRQQRGQAAAQTPAGGIPIVQDAALEREADAGGQRAVMPAAWPRADPQATCGASGSRFIGVQRQEIAKDEAKIAAAKTPLEEARSLVQESPATVKACATWILKAADQGFVTFNTTKAKTNLEGLRGEERVGNLDPKAAGYDVPILKVEIDLIDAIAQDWIDKEGAGAKPTIQLGSLIRTTKDPHGKGKAIDINNLRMITSVEATVQILEDLNKETHSSYGVGLPFQGEFFDPADDLEKKKRVAASSMPPDKPAPEAKAAAETDISAADKPKSGSGIGPAKGQPAAQPESITVKDGVKKFHSHIYRSVAAKSEGGELTWKDTIQDAGAAQKRLKSQKLKTTFGDLTTDGFGFTIFPDNDDHLHLDVR